MLSIKPSIKIVATLLVKNEEDIIGLNIEHHIQQGVGQFIITDNASRDQTRHIVEKYPEVVEIIDEPGDTHNQSAWVTRMARLACKLNPDWIIHLDADELWCNLAKLRQVKSKVAACEGMYLHPPIDETFDWGKQKYYLNFDQCDIPKECKIAHQPDPNIIITHGNHGVEGAHPETETIPHHHYPVRSYTQWARKALGHLALKKRNISCSRWENWYNLLQDGKLEEEYRRLIRLWKSILVEPTHDKFISLLGFWDGAELFEKHPETLPTIGTWPREDNG